MNTERALFSRLLTCKDLYSLYTRIGDSLIKKIDINSLSFDKTGIENSLQLLYDFGLVTTDNDKLKKTDLEVKNFIVFKKILLKNLEAIIKNQLIFSEIVIKFEEKESKFYFARNSVNLDFSGLVMLLNDLGRVYIKNDRVYINDTVIIENSRKNSLTTNRKFTIIDLKNKLLIQDELGSKAEALAMEYEKAILRKKGIAKEPTRVSDIDTSAGYDIASYENLHSIKFDKFIEVKSCLDLKFQFYMSKNEIEKAKLLGKSYYLYLLNRETNQFWILRDPYNSVIKDTNWAVEPQIFRINKMFG